MYLNNYTYVTILHSVLAERILYDITVSDAIAMITLTWQYPHFASSFCLFSQLLFEARNFTSSEVPASAVPRGGGRVSGRRGRGPSQEVSVLLGLCNESSYRIRIRNTEKANLLV